MGQKLGIDGQASEFPLFDRFAEMGGVPVNYDGSAQVEPGSAVVLALTRQVKEDRVLQMFRLGIFHLSVIRSSRSARRRP